MLKDNMTPSNKVLTLAKKSKIPNKNKDVRKKKNVAAIEKSTVKKKSTPKRKYIHIVDDVVEYV